MKTLTLPSAANLFLLCLLAILIAAASVSWSGSLHWADQQRVAHLGFLALAACAFLWQTPRSFYASRTLTLLLIPFSLGLLSSLLAEYPSYALKDWSLFVGFVIYLVIVQFDGVSTPYTHLWLAVLVGIALQRWAPVQPTTQPAPAKSYFEWLKPLWIWRFFAFLVALTCLSVLVYELPKLAEQAKAHAENYHPDLKPRFWTQGWIPMNPDSTAK